MQTIEINEWENTPPFLLTDLSDTDIDTLYRLSEQTRLFEVDFGYGCLTLKANGRVGQCLLQLPAYGPVLLVVHTKVPVTRLLEWWCWSEVLLQTGPYLVPLQAYEDIVEQLACWLSQRVLHQARKGLLSAYLRKTAALSSPKGRILMRPSALMLARGQAQLSCHFEERSQDIPENQVLLWTLEQLRRHRLRHPTAIQLVQAAHRILRGSLTIMPFSARECTAFAYNRLNKHYEPMHRICGMILSQIGLEQQVGEKTVPTFVLEMNRVFEGAVANALAYVVGSEVSVVAQEPHLFSISPMVRILMDLVIRAKDSQQALMVLDTKYKHGELPSNSDIYQIVSYACALGTDKAYLVYPHSLKIPMNCQFGEIQCQSIAVPMSQPVLEAIYSLFNSIKK